MENYTKGKNTEEEFDLKTIPIPNLPDDLVWMKVKGGSRMGGLVKVGLEGLAEGKPVLWSGAGAALNKTISCVEISKRNFPGAHQFNKICYIRCVEEWEPKEEGLDKLIVKRDIPAIHILLTTQPTNPELPGYQGPTPKSDRGKSRRGGRGGPFRPINAKKFTQAGLRSSNIK